MGSDVNVVEIVPCTSAVELLETLRPYAPRWRSRPGDWIFRGHADETWKLVPSVNRIAHVRKFISREVQPIENLYCEPTVGEAVQLLADFEAALNRAGLEVPGTRSAVDDLVVDRRESPFNARMKEVAALAQHHGMPTWLLDWTAYGTVAAYFAASDVVHAPATEGLLAVWALNRKAVDKGFVALGVFDGNMASLELVEIPRAGNANLHAQAGVFTLARPSRMDPNFDDKVGLMPVDELLLGDKEHEHPMVYKFTLPRSEAGVLLKWLAYEPVTGATLFPDLEGVVRDVRDRRRWPR